MKIFLCLVPVLCVSVSAETEDFAPENHKFSASFYNKFSEKNSGNFLASPYSVQAFLALNIHSSEDSFTPKHLHRPDVEQIPTFDNDSLELEAYTKLYLRQEHYPADNESFQITRVFQDSRVDFKAAWAPALEPLKDRFRFHVGEENVVFVQAVQNHYNDVVLSKHLLGESYSLKAKFLQIPLIGDDASVTFVLPNEQHGLKKLESRIDQVFAFNSYTAQNVRYIFPKLQITHETNLKDLGHGVESENKQTLAAEEINVVVTERIHTASLSMDKDGINGGKDAHPMHLIVIHPLDPETPKFIADHPFMFYVRVKGVIVYVGRVENPKY